MKYTKYKTRVKLVLTGDDDMFINSQSSVYSDDDMFYKFSKFSIFS